MNERRTVALMDLDADLAQLVPPELREAARAELRVETRTLSAGPWEAEGFAGTNPQHVGLLLLDGVVTRELLMADTVSTELLGPGDAIRPWSTRTDAPMLEMTVRWTVLVDSHVALLDRRFGNALVRWPEVNAVLIDRLEDRARRLAATQAISQLNRVDRRLLALFWHMADRWGRVGSDGVAIPLTLSHRMLGQLVGARRPTVTSALRELARRGQVVRCDDGTWLLKGAAMSLAPTDGELVPIRRRMIAKQDSEQAER